MHLSIPNSYIDFSQYSITDSKTDSGLSRQYFNSDRSRVLSVVLYPSHESTTLFQNLAVQSLQEFKVLEDNIILRDGFSENYLANGDRSKSCQYKDDLPDGKLISSKKGEEFIVEYSLGEIQTKSLTIIKDGKETFSYFTKFYRENNEVEAISFTYLDAKPDKIIGYKNDIETDRIVLSDSTTFEEDNVITYI